jgi:uncharacterized protein
MTLPNFRCYPDPLASGSIEASQSICACCGKARGYVYVGATYGEEDDFDCICPWCIADGSAHARLKVEFNDPGGVGGYGLWEAVPQAVVDEIAYRTPGFISWQQGQWPTCCGDAAAFLGNFGYPELVQLGEEAVEAIRQSAADFEGDADIYLHALRKNGSPAAYLFQCLHCKKYLGYSDSD